LNFKLLAESNHAVVQMYGSIMEYNSMTFACAQHLLDRSRGRDQEGVLQLNPQGHSEEVLVDLQQLQSAK
jgi:peroxiredoxin